MMALINDDLTITRYKVINLPFMSQTLNHCHIQVTVWFALAGTDLADVFRFDAEEQ